MALEVSPLTTKKKIAKSKTKEDDEEEKKTGKTIENFKKGIIMEY